MEHGSRYARLFVCLLWLSLPGAVSAAAEELSLSEVYQRVEQQSPNLAAAAAALSAADEGVSQARALPNPELEIEMEDFGSGPIEVMISQELAIGGTRGAVIRRAAADRNTARYSLEAARLQQRAEGLRRFARVLAAKRKVIVADSLVALAQATMASIRHRVEIGSAVAVDSIRTDIELREIRLQRAEAAREYSRTRQDLAALWGDVAEPNWEPMGDFECGPLPLAGDELLRSVDAHPALKAMESEVQALIEDHKEARAGVFPGLSVGVGFVHEPEEGSYAALVRSSLPLPLLHRNQGAIAQTNHRIESARQYLIAEHLARRNAAVQIMDQIAMSSARIAETEQSLIPRSELILQEVTAHYQRGSVSILEVIDAQRSLMELLREHTENLAERACFAADLMELAGVECPVFL